MLKRSSTFVIIALFFLSINNSVRAAELALTSIGALSTGGAAYTEWWYSGTNPTLGGTAGEDAEVTITINDSTQTVQADSSGNWSVSTTLAMGDHDITISSEGDSYSFVLHTGQSMSGTSTDETSESTVPDTGSNQVSGFLMTLIIAIFGYIYYINSKKLVFAKFEKDSSKR